MRRSDSAAGGEFITTWATKSNLTNFSYKSSVAHFYYLNAEGNFFFHRARFLSALEQDLPRDRIHFGKRLTSYEEADDKVILHFKDGSTATCDVLVAADGIKSTVRSQMLQTAAKEKNMPELENLIQPRWSGTVAYRSLLDAEDVKEKCPDHPVLRTAQMVSDTSLFSH
jgi:salicylate hydroxylase